MAQTEIIYDESLEQHLQEELDPRMRQVARALEGWARQARAVTNRSTAFSRTAYVTPDNPLEQMVMARRAVRNDDVVGLTADVTEALAIQEVKWDSSERDEADIMGQMAEEYDLDALVRKMYREDFTTSQVTLAFWWDHGEFVVRSKSKNGNARKKTYDLTYPSRITVLDSARVVPVGMMAFGQERLAWFATAQEFQQYEQFLSGQIKDDLMSRFYEGIYQPMNIDELDQLARYRIDPNRLILLNDNAVKRFTSTRPDHLRFSDVRVASVFRLLDMKQQLMEADRVNLIGAANYLLLVKKGDKDAPGTPSEIKNLQEGWNVVAKVPVIFSDHRLSIEIITPKTDFVLTQEKYDVLDNRILARLLNILAGLGGRSSAQSDLTRVARPLERTLEAKRRSMAAFLQREIGRAIVEHPDNKGKLLDRSPRLAFSPPRIHIDDDTGFNSSILQMRTMNEISRETLLEIFGLDQATEAIRRIIEEEQYDDTFKTMVPFSAAGGQDGEGGAQPGQPPAASGAAGVRGGRPNGGGVAKKTAKTAPAAKSSGNARSGSTTRTGRPV